MNEYTDKLNKLGYKHRVRYNATFVPEGVKDQQNIDYNVGLQSSIISNPSLYYLAITRFNIPGVNIPVHVPKLQGGPTFYLTEQELIFAADDGAGGRTEYTAFVPYVAETVNGPIPTIAKTSDPYFWIYSYTHFAIMTNAGFRLVHDQIYGDTPSLLPPRMTYDSNLEKFVLYVPQKYVDDDVLITGNARFASFYSSILTNTYYTNNENREFYTYPDSFKTYELVTIDGQKFYKIISEYKNFGSLTPLRSIVLTTDTLPVVPEFFQGNTDGEKEETRRIITSYVPLLDLPGDVRTNLNYSQSGPYRLIDMVGDNPITQISFKIFWVTRYGDFVPLFVNNDAPVDIMFEFLRKDTFTG